MRLFDDEAKDQYAGNGRNLDHRQIQLPTSESSVWGSSAETLRPGSINIPDFDNSDSLDSFAPAATPWFMASATSVSFGAAHQDDTSDLPGFGMSVADDVGDDTSPIQLPPDPNGPNTIRPGFASSFSAFNPNPFPPRIRQQSGDSTFSSGPFGGLSSGPSMSSFAGADGNSDDTVPTPEEWDFTPDDSSETGMSRPNVAQSPSLPTLATRQEESPTASRSRAAPHSLMSRTRSNTAPNFDSANEPGANILKFSGRNQSPFSGQRSNVAQRPNALTIPVNTVQSHLVPVEVRQIVTTRKDESNSGLTIQSIRVWTTIC